MGSDYPEPPPISPASRTAATVNSEEPHLDIKRPRACEPCRQLKVRCDPDPAHPDSSCKRCAKAGRACVVTAPTRKRQKKTDSRVTELERKIDALTATLQASHRGAFGLEPPPKQESSSSHSPEIPGRRWLRDDPNLAGSKRHHDGLLVSQYPRQDSPSAEKLPPQQSSSRQWRVPSADETAPSKAGNEFVDMIDRGVVDVETAQAAFDRYITKMAPEMPMVVFPPGTTMGFVRRERPALFLAILAVAIGPFKKDMQLKLLDDVYRMCAERVVVKGEKSIELVQAFIVLAIWYMPPDNLEELKFYQLVHFAVVVSMDLGLNRRKGGEDRPFSRLREVLLKKPQGSTFDINGPEAKRTWVGCYFMAVQVSTALRRTHLVRWQPYMDECLHTLENHPDALPSDKHIIWWAKLGQIIEESSTQLTTDDPLSIITFADSKIRYAVKGFSNQLAQWRREVPEDAYSLTLAHTYHVINLFVHESAMSVDCRESCLPNSPNNDLPTSVLAPLIDAISTCIHSIHQSLDIICSIEPDRLICLPTVALARTSYPVVSLIKIYSLLVASNTHIGQVIDMNSLKIEYYLEKVITHYRTAAARDGGRAASKFGNIIMMLRNWFLKKRENGPALREIFGTEVQSDTQGDKQAIQQGTTPLHLLSEVAMGDPASRAPSSASQSRSDQEKIYTPSTYRQNPGPPTYGPINPPTPLTRMPSKSDQTPSTTPWASTPSFSPSIPGNSGPGYYPSFTTPDPTQGYNGIQSSAGPSQPGYPDMSSMGLSGSQPMGMVQDLGMDVTFDSDNLFALGTMMDEGLFTFPLAFDGDFQM
ncbi:uncharacterized protein N7496_000145 [Penicillium cataractarum]|uniref:Zn(2)-C6 fungal-type domain-containing protein n=1 Tax=Penicillium cataractarum TaxID=2100454 RepID=A0A9X0B5T2_9EURO|nr:uncharacterized protein N7496_000145 [Penicillium cataractarum]KAJ5389077.1 hypothetical protein N7496_000145 [Penicillium cataractarum]